MPYINVPCIMTHFQKNHWKIAISAPFIFFKKKKPKQKGIVSPVCVGFDLYNQYTRNTHYWKKQVDFDTRNQGIWRGKKGNFSLLPVGRHASESNDPVDIFLWRTLVRFDGELARCRELAACVLPSLQVGRIWLGHSTLSSDKRKGEVTVIT